MHHVNTLFYFILKYLCEGVYMPGQFKKTKRGFFIRIERELHERLKLAAEAAGTDVTNYFVENSKALIENRAPVYPPPIRKKPATKAPVKRRGA